MYTVIPASDRSYNRMTVTQNQKFILRPVNPMPEYLGKIDSVGYTLFWLVVEINFKFDKCYRLVFV